MKKRSLKEQKGITLIALVVTIVVLLILAGVSISMLSGENGIIRQAQEAKDKTKAEAIKERIQLWKSEQKINEYTRSTMAGTLADKLLEEGLITEEERDKLANGDSIQVGDENIALVPTIGEIYSEELIGTVIKNPTIDGKLPEGTENSWIILGKDKDGSIMLTTAKPIENGVTLNCTAEAWLSYEEDLNTACSIYGGIIQGKEIKSRSITIEDVNRVTGFVEPTFNTYTFTNEATNDYANKRVNYWHPDKNGTATESDGTGNPNFWSKNEKTYECDAYYYRLASSDNKVECGYEGNDWNYEDYTGTLKNTNIIFGDELDYFYHLASRSVCVGGSDAYFYGTRVALCHVGSYAGGDELCASGSDGFNDHFYVYGNSDAVPVRPVINLPSDIEVKKVSGEWTIID